MCKLNFKIGAGGRLTAKHPEGFVFLTPVDGPHTFDHGWRISTSFDHFTSATLPLNQAKDHANQTYMPVATVIEVKR